jgi:hypothetical protein
MEAAIRVAHLIGHTLANPNPVPTMLATSPFLVPILAAILSTGPEPVRPISVAAPRSSIETAIAAASRIPAVGRVIQLYRGPVQPKLGYGSRPRKHIRVGVSFSF